MSLPACQQRVLDGMDAVLQASFFAILYLHLNGATVPPAAPSWVLVVAG
jgi:hypothetical protein